MVSTGFVMNNDTKLSRTLLIRSPTPSMSSKWLRKKATNVNSAVQVMIYSLNGK